METTQNNENACSILILDLHPESIFIGEQDADSKITLVQHYSIAWTDQGPVLETGNLPKLLAGTQYGTGPHMRGEGERHCGQHKDIQSELDQCLERTCA